MSEFYRKGKGYKHCCKLCHNHDNRLRNQTEEAKELNRRCRARYRYGITDEELDELLELPCAICGKEGEVIDHNHATGKVRGRLCHSCNTGLGKLKDSPTLLRAAAAYLETQGHYG